MPRQRNIAASVSVPSPEKQQARKVNILKQWRSTRACDELKYKKKLTASTNNVKKIKCTLIALMCWFSL